MSAAQKMKFSIKDFFSKYHQIHRKRRIWSQEILNGKLHFCAVVKEEKPNRPSKSEKIKKYRLSVILIANITLLNLVFL